MIYIFIKIIEILKEFPDREFLCKALFKELLGKDNLYTNVCAIIIIEAVENEIFEAQVYNLLKDEKAFKDRYCKVNNVTDRTKKIIDLKGCESYTL